MKIAQASVGILALASILAVDVQAQNVGIGVANPQSKLSVNGTSSSGGLAIGDPTYTSTAGTFAPTNGAIIEGNVGIGTTNPVAPLHVGTLGSPIFNPTGSPNVVFYNYLNTNTSGFTIATYGAGAQPVSALFASNIWSNGSLVSYSGTFASASDARLKNIIGRSDSAKDLETLEKIDVTDYTMKDVVRFGSKQFKKVIAQQVEKVYPTAVSSGGVKGFTFTPDVYSVSDSIKMERPGVYTISLAKAHDLKDGDTVRLITSKDPELNAVVHVVNDKSFTVQTKQPLGDKVFVYGKESTDLKTVDYDAISMLNVSATQELANKVDRLEHANENLKAEVEELRAANQKLTKITTDIESLKKVVATIQEKKNEDIKAVALEQ